MRKIVLILVIGVFSLGFVFAGGAKEEPKEEPAKENETEKVEEKKDLSFTDVTGVTETLPDYAERIVCITEAGTDICLEIGLEPVAINDQPMMFEEGFWGKKAESFGKIGGSFFEPNIEDIARAKPDLIIGLYGDHDNLREALSDIAPLYIVHPTHYMHCVENLKEIGRLTGREKEAEAAANRFLKKLQAYKDKSPKNKSAVFMGVGKTIYVSTEGALTGSLLAEVAKAPFPAVEGTRMGRGVLTINAETILEKDPDVIFANTGFKHSPLEERIAKQPLLRELSAYKNGTMHHVSLHLWSYGRGTRSLSLVLDEGLPLLYPEVFPEPLKVD